MLVPENTDSVTIKVDLGGDNVVSGIKFSLGRHVVNIAECIPIFDGKSITRTSFIEVVVSVRTQQIVGGIYEHSMNWYPFLKARNVSLDCK